MKGHIIYITKKAPTELSSDEELEDSWNYDLPEIGLGVQVEMNLIDRYKVSSKNDLHV